MKNSITYSYPDESLLELSTGFDIGFDYARFNINLPDDPPKVFMDGYHAFKVKNKYYTKSTIYERRVVRLRYSAWRRNRTFDPGITAEYLESITTEFCPITRKPFTWGLQADTDASVERASNAAGYAVGNIIYISNIANQAKGGKSFAEMLEIYKEGTGYGGLTSDEWCRLTYLSYACDGSAKGNIRERLAIFPMYLFLPNHIDVCNVLVLLQRAVAVACLPMREFPIIKSSQHTQLLKTMSGVGNKRSVRLFKQFCSVYSDVLHCLRRDYHKRNEIENQTSCLLADMWCQPGVTELFVKWVDSFDLDQMRQLLRNIEGIAELCQSSNWHTDTGGYVVPVDN